MTINRLPKIAQLLKTPSIIISLALGVTIITEGKKTFWLWQTWWINICSIISWNPRWFREMFSIDLKLHLLERIYALPRGKLSLPNLCPFTFIILSFHCTISIKFRHAFSCVLSDGLSERVHSHTGYICICISPLCVFKCLRNVPASADA